MKEGAGIWFQFIASGSENPSYQWYFMGNPVSGANSCRFVIPSVTLSDSGYYQCIAWNGCGQVYSDTAWLTTHADGITNPSGKQAMLLYPDPVINEISVYTGIPRDKKYRISIYNSLGELKAEKEGKSGNGILRFTTEDLASGFYLLDLNINGLHQRLKFIRQ